MATIRRLACACALILALASLADAQFGVLGRAIPRAASGTPDPGSCTSALPLVTSGSLVFDGTWRIPQYPSYPSGAGMGDARYGAAYNSTNNSLVIIGSANYNFAVEINVATAVSSSTIGSLNTGTIRQDTSYPVNNYNGREAEINPSSSSQKITNGVFLYGGKLIFAEIDTYDANATQVLSHWVHNTTFATINDLAGPYQVGSVGAGRVAGYMASIPSVCQTALGGPVATGNNSGSIIGRSSAGPAAFSINPANFGITVPLPGNPLVYYPIDHHTISGGSGSQLGCGELGQPLAMGEYFNCASGYPGMVCPKNTRSCLFFGRLSAPTSLYCYGQGESTDPSPPPEAEECYTLDEAFGTTKGNHGWPYVYQVLAYDVLDFIDVRNNVKQPWEVVPYAAWTLTMNFSKESKLIVGAAYDDVNNKIFLLQANVDEDPGHAFQPVVAQFHETHF